MYKFILLLGLVLFSFGSSVNTAQVGQVWVPGSHKATVESGTAQMITIGQHLTTIVPMIDPNELECMAKNIYFEAAVESTAGKMAVAQVTMNRVKSSSYPDTICAVVYEGKHHSNGFPVRDRCQFSWYCDGKGDEPRETPAWRDSQEIAEYVIRTPSLIDITDGATHYHADYIDSPRWAYQKKKLVKIDTHIFYKKRGNFNL
tara:strand:- start:1660 stop:2265 length:606 start_codon:yes stop_codon:yes gene_type:complete